MVEEWKKIFEIKDCFVIVKRLTKAKIETNKS